MALARAVLTAIDAPEPFTLAGFYSQLIGGEVQVCYRNAAGDPEWVEIREGAQRKLAFQLVPDYQAPTWPNGRLPQQRHLDLEVEDLDAGETFVVAIGAVKSPVQPGETFRVFLDPAGHPFCLVSIGALD
jgi:hypothetical protein